MSENLSVICLRDDRLCWLDAGKVFALDDKEPQALERLRLTLAQRDHKVVFAVPGGETRLLELDVTPEERKHLDASLPYMLEESLSDNIDGLHFSRLKLDRDRYLVAIVDKQAMQRWEENLGEFAGLVPWVPEALLLPWSGGEWTLVVGADSTLLRVGRGRGSRIENALLPTLLASLLAETVVSETGVSETGVAEAGSTQISSTATGAADKSLTEADPTKGESTKGESDLQRVVVYGQDESADLALLSTLSSLKAGTVQWRRGGLPEALLLSRSQDRRQDPALNLLQGDYAPQLPYARWWGQWRKVAALLLVALSIHLLSAWLDLRRFERENVVLRTEIQSIYRQVNPRGAVVDAEKQLRRQLDALRGGGAGTSFTGLLAPFGAMFSEQSNMQLASLSYSKRSAEIRVNLLAANFADVESLRSALETAGYMATLESSSRSGDRVRARLRIGDRS